MALFTDRTDSERARSRSGWFGWTMLGIGMVSAAVLSMLPAPYVIERPGPVFDTLGVVETPAGDVPLIEIPDEPTYPTEGALSLLTVSVVGTRERPPSWIELVPAWFDPTRSVVPVDSVFPEGLSREQSAERSRIEMENSQREAIAAALTELGYRFSSVLTIAEVIPGGPADGKLQAGDVVVSFNDETFTDVTGLRAAIADNGTDRAGEMVVRRNGVEQRVELRPELSDSEPATPMVGVYVGSEYEFPFEVDIQLENVGGPSAGMMFALGIIDKLTPGALNGGEAVAGTGTISATGAVGPIGGIRQKMYGARDAGAEWFLAPSANCDEVTGNEPHGLSVFRVDTLDDALDALRGIASGDVAGLPVCTG
ncbi:YlbL family protein [Ruicaihuangia caeni]|uniref:endopeptidase La n=1 Tax=Ruicaihuangia caeni TaxID=3042517 RepID=A0AAW6T778_9MICO|nr:S16 family serine protease [Klugiella sp. YN-L-19]MDI2099681.1 PDZ domain-containing protein [Klugiella sp. YN-L-19]